MGQDEVLALIEQAGAEGWTELDLSGRGLKEIPAAIGNLSALTSLKLHNNQITLIPEAISKLSALTKLDLNYNQITEIPETISKLSALTKLDLNSNQITQISEAISNLTSLTSLDLGHNQITLIPKVIGNLNSLTLLYLSGNQITLIPEAMGNLTSLTELYFGYNRITVIPETISNLTSLNLLYLWGNKITEIPQAIGNLTSLTSLDLSGNQITLIPEVIGNLTSLIELYLGYNRITVIPETISNLTSLNLLYLSDNQLTQIPEAIGNLTSLTSLDLSGNQITLIPEAISNLTSLTKLYLGDNQITLIPEVIGNLTSLTELYLGYNRITLIPEAMSNLSSLTELNLSGNQITLIPEAMGNLTSLTELYFGYNRITVIPETISNLTSLNLLYLWGNKITEIPQTIGNLTSLISLNISSNQITQIPEAIGNLTSLTEVKLSGNKITEIPQAIGNLTSLISLNISSNQITQIPEAIGNLTSLTEVKLSGNKITNIPVEILSSSTKEILNYLRQVHTNKTRPLHEAKLLLVGQGSVGKTSLRERLLRNYFDKNQPQTDGLNVEPWQVHVNSKDVRLNVWDFGGQEIYHATHQFFLTKRSLYLLVCNCRTSEEENRIEYWLKLIASFGGESPVIIVGNKKDEQPFDINRKALREKYPNIQAIIETSCQDNLGIDELRKAIYTEVAGLKEVYDLLPLPWFEVKEHLEGMTQDFISYNQYLGICHTKNIPEEQNQEQLIDLLHRLGLVLNFREHDFLKNTNVLKPDWVTEGIYTLLSDETLKTINKGIFTYTDLSRVLNPQRYPQERHRYLIELMKEFELCFALDCQPLRFLIPGLLPKDEPEDTRLEGETLEFQYHYQVLPQSIISRFIVLTHTQIHKETYWRSGVMLEDKEGKETLNIARIKADPEDKKIFITISGREQTRRSFLKTIRDVFKKIHSSFTNPEITEWVPVPNHPDHPPLDYQELLGLEDMGESEVKIGKLKLKINLRQLLDGYESLRDRQKQLGVYIKEQNNYYQNGEGDNFAGDQVGRDKRR